MFSLLFYYTRRRGRGQRERRRGDALSTEHSALSTQHSALIAGTSVTGIVRYGTRLWLSALEVGFLQKPDTNYGRWRSHAVVPCDPVRSSLDRLLFASDVAPLWGKLTPGPHGVGFTVRSQYDYSVCFVRK